MSVTETGRRTRRPGAALAGDVLISAVAAVSWAFIGMVGVAALGLHLLDADAAGSLGPMTAAAVTLGVGGRVAPSGDVSAFGLDAAQAHTAIDVAPLGVGLTGALLLSWFFLRSLRSGAIEVGFGELAARAGTVAALFLGLLGGLSWAGHDLITIDGTKLGLGGIPDKGGLPAGITDRLPGGVAGLLPDRLGDLAGAKASVGFTVRTGPTLVGGAVFVLGVLVIALLASRRTPLPRALDPLHRVVRPAVSALVGVVLVAVLAGLAAAAYAMAGDEHPRRIAGAALLGAPNGVWLAVPLGLFVPWDGAATGELAQLLPDPLGELLRVSADEPVTVARLAELDGRVWLLPVGAALMMLCAGVLTAARTPRQGALALAGHCALRLGAVTALALPLLVRLTDVSASSSLSVLGFDAFDAGVELHGRTGMALLLGAVWGAGAGACGALLAVWTGAAGARAAPLSAPEAAGPQPGPYAPPHPYGSPGVPENPYLEPEPDPPRGEVRDDVSAAPTMAAPLQPPRPAKRPRSASWPPPPPPPPPPPADGGL
ncbi:streptophobe family protein [Streptomyces sp. NPDC050145]|uniref:streptophobe family protein n=1 Tax=Streptomyces sp. NPDC050145 TaxID=3365602 RepID=UPI0037BD018D